MNIAVAGTGYVGLSILVLLAQHNKVQGDVQRHYCKSIRQLP